MIRNSFGLPLWRLAGRLVPGAASVVWLVVLAAVTLTGGQAVAQGRTMDLTQADMNRLLNGPLTWDQLGEPDFTSGRVSDNWDDARKIDVGKRVTPCAPDDRKLYPDGRTGPDPNLLPTQGTLGDCTFVAAAMALARLNPDAIKNMIQDHGDGTFTVTFPGRPPVTFTYDPDAHGAGRVGGVWLHVLEQAAARVLNNPTLVAFPDVPIRLLTGSDSDWSGGWHTEFNWQYYLTALSATSSRSRGEVQQAFLGGPDFPLGQPGT